MILIKNGHIKPISSADIDNGCVLLGDDGKIVKVAKEIEAPADCTIIDAEGRLVTPGCVEAHCHVGRDYNEKSNPVTPHMRGIDSIYPQDESLADALAGGVTTGCTGPGSSNVIGGTFAAIKLYGNQVEDMLVKEPVAMKCAFGESTKSASKNSPITRMGIAALLRETLYKARDYQQAKDKGQNPKFDMKMEAMLPVMRGEIPLKAHAHRVDDILTSIRIAKEFGLKLTLDHCTDGYIVAEDLAQEGYSAIIGPIFGSKSKSGLRNKPFQTPGALHKAGVKICITTDAPALPLSSLPMCAGFAVSGGLPMEDGWKAITLSPAEIMGIADRVGSLEEGKDADVVIWTDDPLRIIGAHAWMTFVNGKLVYQD